MSDCRVIAAAVVLGAGMLSGCAPEASRPLPRPPAASLAAAAPRTYSLTDEPWSFMQIPGRRLVTDHWDIRTTMDSDHLVDSLPHFYESAFARYTTALGDLPSVQRPLVTYIFGDKRQWKNQTKLLVPAMATRYETLGRGGFSSNGIACLYDIDRGARSRDTLALASHEGWHQYTQTAFRQRTPTWLEEGIATWMEGHEWHDGTVVFNPANNRERRSMLSEAFYGDHLMPIREVLSGDPNAFLDSGKRQLLAYYGQVWALTRFLMESDHGYAPAVERILQDAARGRLYEQTLRSPVLTERDRADVARRRDLGVAVMRAYIQPDLDLLEDQFRAFIETRLLRRNWWRSSRPQHQGEPS